MKRAFALALCSLACAMRPVPVDPGAVHGDTYENAAFDLAVSLPPGWAFLTPEEIERGMLAAPDGTRGAVGRSKAARADTTTLFGMVDRAQAPSAGQARRAVLAHAQSFPSAPAGLSSETVASELEAGLRGLTPPIDVGGRRQAIVAGRRFVVVPTAIEYAGVGGRLDHYVRYEPDRVLVLTVSYPPEDGAPPQQAIEAIRPLAPATPRGEP